MITRVSNPSEMSAWIGPSVQPPIASQVIAEAEGNPGRVVEEGDNEYQLQLGTSCISQHCRLSHYSPLVKFPRNCD